MTEVGLRTNLERTVLYGTGADERHDHGDNVHGQLELEELGDTVVDIPAPHDGLDNAGEVVVCKDDVGGFLGHVSAGNAHSKANVSFLESWGVVGAVTGDCDNLPPC